MRKPGLRLIPLMLIATALAGCNEYTELQPVESTKSPGITAFLSLTAQDGYAMSSSRAVKPTEAPVRNEGRLYDAIVVIYGSSLSSASLSGSVLQAIDARLTETESGSSIYRTDNLTLELTPGTYYYTVVANPHQSITANTFKKMTLTNLRDYVYTPAPYATASTAKSCDRFVMTSDSEGSFTVTDANYTGGATLNISGASPMVVERLAARIDLSFGAPASDLTSGVIYRDVSNATVTFSGASPSVAVSSIVLPVYDYALAQDNKMVLTGDTYTITSVELLNVVKDQEYLIQRTAEGPFADELWDSTTGESTKTVITPSTLTKDATTGSISLASLIADGNNLYTKDNSRFYTLGYYRENTMSDGSDPATGKTAIKICGTYHRTGDLESATSDASHNIVFALRHCNPEGDFNADSPMAYAVVRNTIYRVRIDKVFSDAERVYVRWYYDAGNDGTYDTYSSSTPFTAVIQEGNSTAPTD